MTFVMFEIPLIPAFTSIVLQTTPLIQSQVGPSREIGFLAIKMIVGMT
jgi:hypothetical protein